MIQLTRTTPTTARIRVIPGHDVTIPWHPDDDDPWRVMYLVTRGLLLAAERDYRVTEQPRGQGCIPSSINDSLRHRAARIARRQARPNNPSARGGRALFANKP